MVSLTLEDELEMAREVLGDEGVEVSHFDPAGPGWMISRPPSTWSYMLRTGDLIEPSGRWMQALGESYDEFFR